MKMFLIGLGGFLSFFLFLLILVMIGGAMMSPSHRAESSIEIPATPSKVYGLVTDFANTASWRGDLKSVEMLSKQGERPKWREFDKDKNNWAYEAMVLDSPRVVVIKIAEPNGPVEGSWTINITPVSGHSRVTIVEEGIVHNLVFRFIGKLFFDQSATIKSYLEALNKRCSL